MRRVVPVVILDTPERPLALDEKPAKAIDAEARIMLTASRIA